MNTPENPPGRPQLQLNGPRPLQLKVHKNSHKIRKSAPPAAAQPSRHHPPPPPVIIYTESPKIIKVDPNEFKSLVQRLTGPNSTSSSTSVNISPPSGENDGGVSAAARTSEQSSGILPPFPQDLFISSSDSNVDLLDNMRENGLIMPQMMNTPSPKNVDILSTLFDL